MRRGVSRQMSAQVKTISVYQQDDKRPILIEPYETVDHRNDKHDILDMVRQHIEERGISSTAIRKAGVSSWNPEKHYRLRHGGYSYNMKAAYQLATAVGLKRTKALSFAP